MSIVMKRTFCALCEIVLFSNNFVSNNVAAGDAVSSEYYNLSLPTVSLTRYFSDLSGLMSQTIFANVTVLFLVTSL